MKRLLFIGAHPDDETFFAAGTFARYGAEGAKVSVVCATHGESGKTGGLGSQEELPQRREEELRNAMNELDVEDVEFLSYRDKQLHEAPVEELREQLMQAIRRRRPQIVMSFDPHGANEHADHIAIGRFAADAVCAAADERWFPSAGVAHRVQRMLWTPPRFLFRMPPDQILEQEPGYDFLIDVGGWREQKVRAFEAHASQFPGLRKLFFDNPDGQRTFHLEAFRHAWGPPLKHCPERDIFVDLDVG